MTTITRENVKVKGFYGFGGFNEDLAQAVPVSEALNQIATLYPETKGLECQVSFFTKSRGYGLSFVKPLAEKTKECSEAVAQYLSQHKSSFGVSGLILSYQELFLSELFCTPMVLPANATPPEIRLLKENEFKKARSIYCNDKLTASIFSYVETNCPTQAINVLAGALLISSNIKAPADNFDEKKNYFSEDGLEEKTTDFSVKDKIAPLLVEEVLTAKEFGLSLFNKFGKDTYPLLDGMLLSITNEVSDNFDRNESTNLFNKLRSYPNGVVKLALLDVLLLYVIFSK